MNYINSSMTVFKETISNFFTINRSLAGTISKWVSSTTVTTLLHDDLVTPSGGFDNNVLAPANDYLKDG